MITSGILLGLFGIWLLLQTLVGDLPCRILSFAPVGSFLYKACNS